MKKYFPKKEKGFTRPPNSRDSGRSNSSEDVRKKLNLVGGFTLVEVMISVGLFTVIMVIGIGAILGVNSTSKKTQSMRTIIDNLSFVMEDMARSMRLGDYFVCIDSGPSDPPNLLDVSVGATQITADGENCNSVSFEPYWQFYPNTLGNQVVYYIDGDAIWKKDPDADFDQLIALTPPEIVIDMDKSGFTVVGSDPADGTQPRITIILSGTITLSSGQQTQFNMQTTVSQRVLDVDSL